MALFCCVKTVGGALWVVDPQFSLVGELSLLETGTICCSILCDSLCSCTTDKNRIQNNLHILVLKDSIYSGMLRLPFVFAYRGIFSCLPSISCTTASRSLSFELQLASNKNPKGGWYTSSKTKCVLTRDSFYTLMALKFSKCEVEAVTKYVIYLSEHMSPAGQIPWKFTESWSGTVTPCYTLDNNPVVDATAQFIIMVGWLYDSNVNIVQQLYLNTRRAHEWLQTFMKDQRFLEPPSSSWETTRQFEKGYMLTTNVLVCHSIRAMELICMTLRESTQQKKMEKLHTSVKAKLQGALFATQEVLPRILGVYWNILPVKFWRSFNQELKYPIPLLTSGPLTYPATWLSWIYGYDDQHTTLIYPWIGFFWIALLTKRFQYKTAETWWELYSDFHVESTIYDMYTPEQMLPVQRAFVQSQPSHSLTLAMYRAAADGLLNQTHLQCPDV